jgi:hypothetical protein
MRIPKSTVRAAALAAFAVLLTACGGSSKPAADGGASDSPSASATTSSPTADPTTTPPGPNTADGLKLKTLLPTASQLPTGWKRDPSDESDTGADLRSPGQPLLDPSDCSQSLTGGGATDFTGDYAAAYATTALTSPNLGSSDLVFNSYAPGDAVRQMAEIRDLVKKCPSFTGKDGDGKSVKTTATLASVPNLGDEAIDVKITPKGPYLAHDVVMVHSGDVIMGIDADNASGSMVQLVPVAKRFAAPLPLKP